MTRLMSHAATLCTAAAALLAAIANASPVTYQVDPAHTFPSFEADHMGISVWRGKMTKSSGTVVFDKSDGSGTIEISIDPASIDFGQKQLNQWAQGKDFFNVKKFPKASYKGRFDGISNKLPTRVQGELTLHGVTHPLTLKINSLKCVPHPMFKRELCGADASATFDRAEFGLDAGKAYGFRMDVDLRIQVEALAAAQ
ncbi:YceI family protein [Aquabacterium sp.]|uniref:YceI family protein n=1 Tax=Aquabacterium sp. TaxID=1872578 RepID=UPI002BD6C764|nr:YceI family protein [Aquabacterium sp.]HSW07935.1 YceI family protein [Aquabacterium sp.]